MELHINDENEINRIVDRVFSALNFDVKEKIDWTLFEQFFHNDALICLIKNDNLVNMQFEQFMTLLHQLIDSNRIKIAEHTIVYRNVDAHEDIAAVFYAYDSRCNIDGKNQKWSGIRIVNFMKVENRWVIINMQTQEGYSILDFTE